MTDFRRRHFLKQAGYGSAALAAAGLLPGMFQTGTRAQEKRPNILFAISDDQSWPHTGAYGTGGVNTPAFDRVASEGVLFENAFCAAPQCSPNRAAILTGRNIWQLEEAGTHASNFPKKWQVYPDLLEESGYEIGYTGKSWGPGNWRYNGWTRNPAGIGYNEISYEDEEELRDGIRNLNYAANFRQFFDQRDTSKPFYFWYGASEPHRSYEQGSGIEAGKALSDAEVPGFLPDKDEIRSDILDYYMEIEWFDDHLARMLAVIEEAGELDNTIVIVTSDNGMPFPRAKANLYEYGTHMPLAIMWKDRIPGGRVVSDLTSSIDYCPTFLEIAGVDIPQQVTGKSLLPTLLSDKEGLVDNARTYTINGRERHTHARPDNLAYPARAIRTENLLYIHNIKPDRWPAGNPDGSGEPPFYHDIDNCPSKTYMLEHQNDPEVQHLFHLGFEKRPEHELYDIKKDPACLNNLADLPRYKNDREELAAKLNLLLEEQNDPRAFGYEVFESYPRYSRMRDFPGFKEQGEYNFDF
jgi:uncharacterized sulfatase